MILSATQHNEKSLLMMYTALSKGHKCTLVKWAGSNFGQMSFLTPLITCVGLNRSWVHCIFATKPLLILKQNHHYHHQHDHHYHFWPASLINASNNLHQTEVFNFTIKWLNARQKRLMTTSSIPCSMAQDMPSKGSR